MKNFMHLSAHITLALVVLGAGFGTACGDTSGIQDEARDVAHESKQLGGAVVDWFALSRDEFSEELDEQQAELQVAMQDLKVRAKSAAATGKQEWQQALGEAQESWERFEDRSADFRDATGEAWKDVREDLVEAVDDVKASLADARERFEEGGTPG